MSVTTTFSDNGKILDRAEYLQVAREVTIIGRNTALSSLADIWPPGTSISGNHSLQANSGITPAASLPSTSA